MPNLVAVAGFLPGWAKDLSAPPRIYFISKAGGITFIKKSLNVSQNFPTLRVKVPLRRQSS